MAFVLTAIVCGIEGPPVRAHDTGDGHTGDGHVHWNGDVEVDGNGDGVADQAITFTIGPGESTTYRLRLSERPIKHDGGDDDGWWVLIRVKIDGVSRPDPESNGIS